MEPKMNKDATAVGLWKVVLAHATLFVLGAFAFGIHNEIATAGKRLDDLSFSQAFLLPLVLLVFLPYGLGYAGYVLYAALFATAAIFRRPGQFAVILALTAATSMLCLRGCKSMPPIP